MVRLEFQKLEEKTARIKFQFLNGTIGVLAVPISNPVVAVFQFLNGTIGVKL